MDQRIRKKILVEQHINLEALGEYAFSSRKVPEFMHYRMIVCSNCDLAYANPVPKMGWIREKYIGAAFDASEESQYAARVYALLLQRILPALPDRIRALDIGTGDGAFLLKLLDAGFDEVIGVEPSAEPVRGAPSSIRPFIEQKFFDGENYEAGKYCLVTCFQVLEHVDDVNSLAKAVFRMLKPGGIFLTVAHNFRSFSARVLGHRSPIFDIEHLQLFSGSSLDYLFKQHGFVKSCIHPTSNTYPISYWLKLAPINLQWKERLDKMINACGFSSISVSLSAGNLMGYSFKPTEIT